VEEVQKPEWEAMPPLPHESLQERAARKEKAEEAARQQKQRRRQRTADTGSGSEAEPDFVARGRRLEGMQPEAGRGTGGAREMARGESRGREGTGARTPPVEEEQRQPQGQPQGQAQGQAQAVRAHPAIFRISSSALRAVIPISGSGTRVLQCLGGPPDWLRRFVLSMGSAVLLYNLSPICTIVAAFYWAWAPIWSAALGNMALRSKYPYAGIWVGRVRKVAPARGADGRASGRSTLGTPRACSSR